MTHISEIWHTGGKRTVGTTLQLEITARCNLRCPACNQGMGSGMVHGMPPQDMSSVFWKILTDLENARFQPHELQLFWFGEPLMHPDFFHMFQVLILEHHRKGLFDQIDLHTNGLLMDDRIIDLFLLAGPAMPEITFSIDAVRPETYRKIRSGGELDTVAGNIIRFMKRREQLGQVLPVCRLQFLVQPDNAEETTEFVEFWSQQINKIARKGPVLSHVSEYCSFDNLRGRWESRINHPIYAHEAWKYSTHKAMMHWKDTIWLKRLNVLPLSRQAEMDRLYEKTMVEQGICSGEQGECRLIAEIDNRIVMAAMQDRQGIDNPFVPENHNDAPASDDDHDAAGEPDPDNNTASQAAKQADTVLGWKGRPPCVAPFMRPVIRFDGTVTVCCNDPLCDMALGSVYDNTLDELFFGTKARYIRQAHISGRASELEVCSMCRNLDGAAMNPGDIECWVEAYGEQTLLDLMKENTVAVSGG